MQHQRVVGEIALTTLVDSDAKRHAEAFTKIVDLLPFFLILHVLLFQTVLRTDRGH